MRTRSDALERVERAQPTQIGSDLRRALFEAVQRENGVVEQRRLAGRRGEVRPLSARTMTEIRNAAERRLATGEGLFITTLWRAIDLAIVSGDAALRRTVEAVASDYGEGLRRGIKDVDLIRKSQQRATERLAGVPPLPRPGMPKGSP